MTPASVPDLLGSPYQDHHVRLAFWYLTTPWPLTDDERVEEAVHALRCAGECGS